MAQTRSKKDVKKEVKKKGTKPARASASSARHHISSSSTPAPSIPTPSACIVPNEVLRQIIPYLADEGPTLARCMRVSPAFNTLAAPPLYRNVIWSQGGRSFPLSCPKPSLALARQDRLTPAKQENLDHIKLITIDRHHRPCDHHLVLKDGELVRPSIQVDVLRRTSKVVDTTCSAILGIRAKKLVVDGVYDGQGLHMSGFANGAEEVTVHLSIVKVLDWMLAISRHGSNLLENIDRISKLTLIFRRFHAVEHDVLWQRVLDLVDYMAKGSVTRTGRDLDIVIVNVAAVRKVTGVDVLP